MTVCLAPNVVLLKPPLGPSAIGFGRVGATMVVGPLFDGPLSRMMFFGPSNCGRRITFGLVGFTGPIVPPIGLWPIEPVPVEPIPVEGGLPIGRTSPPPILIGGLSIGMLVGGVPPVTGPLSGGWSIGMIVGGVPRMQRWNSPPLSFAQGSLFTTIGGLGS